MHEEYKKPELNEICQIEKDLISTLKTVVGHGVFSKEVDSKELGELVDMVKDMAETKRNCWEACYYETVTKAMLEYDYDNEDMMGYNRNRYSSGRYAPTGTGDRTTYGYTPYLNRMPMPMRPGTLMGDDGLMGYSGERKDWSSYDDNRRMGNKDHGNQYGSAFREYEDAKRHYTETKSLEDKSHMDDKALEHVNQSMMTLREIWKNADPTIRKEVSSSIASLASEFKSA